MDRLKPLLTLQGVAVHLPEPTAAVPARRHRQDSLHVLCNPYFRITVLICRHSQRHVGESTFVIWIINQFDSLIKTVPVLQQCFAVNDAPILSLELARRLVNGGRDTVLMNSADFHGLMASRYLVARWTSCWEFSLVNYIHENSTDIVGGTLGQDLSSIIATLASDRASIVSNKEAFLVDVNRVFDICALASRFFPSRVAIASQLWISRIPSSAMPSALG